MPLNRSVLNSWGLPFAKGLGRLALLERFRLDENGYHLTAPLARHWRATKIVACAGGYDKIEILVIEGKQHEN